MDTHLLCASEQLRDDEQIVLPAIQQRISFLKYASSRLQKQFSAYRSDKEFMMSVIRHDGHELQYLASQNGSYSGHVVTSKGKDMNGAPTLVYDVSFVRNAGWRLRVERHKVTEFPIVVGGVTPTQGGGKAVHRAKWERWVS